MNFTKTLDTDETSLGEDLWQKTSGSGQKNKLKTKCKRKKEGKRNFLSFDRGTQATCLHRCGYAMCTKRQCVQVRTVLNSEAAYF